jgi:predicted nucleic acid-binding protein
MAPPSVLLDANVIFAGIVGSPDGPSAVLLATIRLGGIDACTTENAMEEVPSTAPPSLQQEPSEALGP